MNIRAQLYTKTTPAPVWQQKKVDFDIYSPPSKPRDSMHYNMDDL